MIRLSAAAAALSLAVLAAAPAAAQEVFGGVYAHDVETPLNLSGDVERGVDFQLGWRGARIRGLRAIGSPSPHAFVSVNSAGDTHFAAAGISWKIGGKVYLRPGIGLAIHTGPSRPDFGERRIDFGSRVLFEPELGVGAALSDRLSVEASWVHLSHATLFSGQNPGIDTIGVRLNYRFR
jgi:lipid A 3-O-deacylase